MTDNANSIQLVIIGAGPGGYAAAYLAADLGMKVTLIDKEANPGGVCLYVGCIPSKALLHVAKVITEAEEAKDWGLEFSTPKIDIDKMREWKNQVVGKLTGGLGQMNKQRKVNYIQGSAKFLNNKSLHISKSDGSEEQLTFENAIIATGSRPSVIPSLSIDSPNVLNSTTALEIKKIPKTMLVIGGGYIGLELGTVYAALGTKVSVVEMMPGLLPGADLDLVRQLNKRLSRKFDSIMLETTVTEIKETKSGIKVKFEGKNASEGEKI